ncbi:MAG: DUF5667 domain-containing protein [bacterium]|nr:DUF5667 domain-containing protein [bacterium]
MSDSLKKFTEDARSVSLVSKEKSQSREHVFAFMKAHPVRVVPEERHHSWSDQILLLFSSHTLLKPMSLILILTLLLGGGTSFAAERALPGSLLYPIKVHVNEEVRGLVAFSAEGEAGWEVRRVERRLEEAEELAHNGDLIGEVKSNIETNFENHADRVNKRIAAFESRLDLEAAADISSDFETSLRAHERILKRLAENEDEEESKTGIMVLATSVRVEIENTSRSRGNVELKFSEKKGPQVETAANGALQAAVNKVAEVRRLIQIVKDALGDRATAQAEARLLVAENAIAEGKVKLVAEAHGEAFALFKKAHRIAQEAKLLIEARRALRLEIEFNGGAGTEDKDEDEDEQEVRHEEKNDDDDKAGSSTSSQNERKKEQEKTAYIDANDEDLMEANAILLSATSGTEFSTELEF